MNKIFASLLVAGLIAMLVGNITNFIYHKNLPAVKRGFMIAVDSQASASKTGKSEAPIDIKALMSSAVAALGKDLFKKCVACHTFEKGGANKIGPNLWGIFDKPKASKDYAYSSALKSKGGLWDAEELYHFLHKPSKHIPGTKMSFVGIEKPQDIANMIAFLKENAD